MANCIEILGSTSYPIEKISIGLPIIWEDFEVCVGDQRMNLDDFTEARFDHTVAGLTGWEGESFYVLETAKIVQLIVASGFAGDLKETATFLRSATQQFGEERVVLDQDKRVLWAGFFSEEGFEKYKAFVLANLKPLPEKEKIEDIIKRVLNFT